MTVATLWFIAGLVTGAGLVVVVQLIRGRGARALAQTILAESQSAKAAELNAVIDQLRTSFAALSGEALSRNTDEFLKLANTRFNQQVASGSEQLESKKTLIDAALQTMNTKVTELANLTQTLDRERRQSVGEIKTELSKTSEVTAKLRVTAEQLREVLANPQRRGQWGERMAEDVLRLVGFQEGVNYRKQLTLAGGDRPDFTFLLPQGLTLNMDAKFPFDNYVRAVESTDATADKKFTADFLRDVRNHVRAVARRGYVDPAGGTVDCVLVFIANEQIYGFIHEHDSTLLDDAVQQKVILCSPMTLYAVLSVIRQAVDHFRLEQTSGAILKLLGDFRGEWQKYGEVVEKMGAALEKTVQAFDSLQTTRTRKLERTLDQIGDLQATQRLTAGNNQNDGHIEVDKLES